MRKATLLRTETDDLGTFGLLTTDSGFQCYIGELPWRDNLKEKSCIPAGTYKCVWQKSPKHGMCYELEKVKDRTDVQIHSANWVGDAGKELRSQVLGCLAPGRAIGEIMGQKAVMSSKDALAGLEDDLDRETFELTISWKEGVCSLK